MDKPSPGENPWGRRIGAAFLIVSAIVLVVSHDADPGRGTCGGKDHRQLDFSLGRWWVLADDGARVATRRAERLMGGCIIVEAWEFRDGHEAVGMITFDPSSGLWHETWADTRGLVVRLTGSKRDERLSLRGTARAPGAVAADAEHRVTWERVNDIRIRYRWETREGTTGGWRPSLAGHLIKNTRGLED